jgi:hypothetical protein
MSERLRMPSDREWTRELESKLASVEAQWEEHRRRSRAASKAWKARANAERELWQEVASAFQSERDQLRQQVEKLLGAVENHRLFHVGGGLGAFHAAKRRSDEETREVEAQQDRNLWDAADQVRKELEG